MNGGQQWAVVGTCTRCRVWSSSRGLALPNGKWQAVVSGRQRQAPDGCWPTHPAGAVVTRTGMHACGKQLLRRNCARLAPSAGTPKAAPGPFSDLESKWSSLSDL